jgi:hypothetical protein
MKTTRVVLRPKHNKLEAETLEKIRGVLAGKISRQDAGEWAFEKIAQPKFSFRSGGLVGHALHALTSYKFGMDPGESALIELKSALKGESEYVTQRTVYTPEDIERDAPGSVVSEEELVRQWPPYAKYLEQARSGDQRTRAR